MITPEIFPHAVKNIYQCTVCGKTFYTYNFNLSKTLTCPFCTKTAKLIKTIKITLVDKETFIQHVSNICARVSMLYPRIGEKTANSVRETVKEVLEKILERPTEVI